MYIVMVSTAFFTIILGLVCICTHGGSIGCNISRYKLSRFCRALDLSLVEPLFCGPDRCREFTPHVFPGSWGRPYLEFITGLTHALGIISTGRY